jgi:flagellar basal body-associated protein FliL
VRAVLGVILIVAFIVCVIGLAAAVTWVVVKISPAKKPPEAQAETET